MLVCWIIKMSWYIILAERWLLRISVERNFVWGNYIFSFPVFNLGKEINLIGRWTNPLHHKHYEIEHFVKNVNKTSWPPLQRGTQARRRAAELTHNLRSLSTISEMSMACKTNTRIKTTGNDHALGDIFKNRKTDQERIHGVSNGRNHPLLHQANYDLGQKQLQDNKKKIPVTWRLILFLRASASSTN